jgi:hypothetical protein
MKTHYFILTAIVLLLLCTNVAQTQNPQAKPDQVELMKQLIGSWKADLGKDTVLYWDAKPFGTRLECYYKTVTKEKILMEGKQLFGYDKKIDKLIESGIMNSNPEIMSWANWFLSPNKFEGVLLQDISNPENATLKWTFELTSPDLMVWTNIVNNKTSGTYTFHQEKK